ncbi:MAG TPA: response regulator transcription factor [Bacteroidota bacterium]|nr:response regulator transcription factor [Bacteroidota bacterium]
MMTILIADDHPIVREGMKQIIAKAQDMTIGGEALNGQEALALLDKGSFDALVLDINMPGRDGLEILKDVRRDHPQVPVLILSMYPEDQVAIRALKAGASGFLNKESAPRELVHALRKIIGGGKYVSEALAEKLALGLDATARAARHDELSDREFQVLKMIASGKEVSEIADELFISVKTVRTYRDRIMEKMNLKNDVELTHYAIKHRLV